MDLNQVLSKLKSTVTGVKSLKLDQELDKAISDINKYRTFNGDRTYLDLVRSLINKLGSVSDIDSIINTEISPASIGQQARLDRYKLYQDIAEKVSYCDRALKVLTDNILAPDDITKRSIEVSSSTPSRDDTEVESLVSEIKTLISKLKLDDNIDETVYSTLLFGDYFIEISDSATSTKNNTIVVEQNLSKDDKKELEIESVKIELDLSHFNFELRSVGDTIEILNEKNELLGESEKPLELDAEDIFLLFHSPRYVVRLQSERFDKVCLGYLVFPKYDYFLMNQTILSNTVDGIISKIAGVLDVALDTKVKIKKNKDVELIVRNVLQQIKDQNQLKVRFVPIDRMIHFRIGSIHKYFPYGQSIFDPVAFQAKLLIAQQVANVIFRLSRSTEKRIIGVEIGLPRDARELVETLKEQFRKRKINIDSFGTLDSIASNIATFEDIYLPMKDGKRFVEVEAGNFGGVDIRGRVDETKFLRDMIVAGLNVPPSFLGIEENLCLTLDTEISCTDGKHRTLKEVIDSYEKGEEIEVYSYDPNIGMVYTNKVKWAGVTRKNTKVCRIHLDNGKYFDCTPDHPVMLRDGTYKEAIKLQEGESLMPWHQLGFSYQTQDICYSSFVENHKVVKVEILEGRYDTGDITVEGPNHNFALHVGVFVHNSNRAALSEENILFTRTVIGYQRQLIRPVRELLAKCYSLMHPTKDAFKEFEKVNISFPIPKSLQFERESKYVGDMVNLIESLKGLGIPKDYLVRRYLTNLDWEDIESWEIKEKIEKTVSPPSEEEVMGGMGGGGAGGF